ncbi:MAG: hypothetical protein BV456_11350 [Thermoplasmata archaeon M8B2D]|nr:MAG: hypothetical protein BV456_11350 [Thermoplasmata archaeon M8B2D]
MVILPSEDSTKIFINCPFDDKYEPIFRAIIFGIIANGFNPVCAKEKKGSTNRLDKILDMIHECGYSIHDISRVEKDKDTGYPRFNMAFELGISIGCQKFGNEEQQKKDFLIFDIDKYRYRNFLSDISGKDLVEHNDSPFEALQEINSWLGTKRIEKSGKPRDYIGSKSIEDFYKEFTDDFPLLCKQAKADKNKLAHHEYIYIASKWLKKKKKTEDIKLEEKITLTDTIETKKP